MDENSHTDSEKVNNIKMDCFFCCLSFGVRSTFSLWFSVRVWRARQYVYACSCGTMVDDGIY